MILVIDDDFDIRDTLAEALRIDGYEVTTAADGQEALNLLNQGLRPELIRPQRSSFWVCQSAWS